MLPGNIERCLETSRSIVTDFGHNGCEYSHQGASSYSEFNPSHRSSS
jgi:hypothetical protein